MKPTRNTYILLGLLGLLVIVAAFTLANRRPQQAAPSHSGYYAGPMRNKNNPSIYTTETGQTVEPPPGASTSTEWRTSTVDKSGKISAE